LALRQLFNPWSRSHLGFDLAIAAQRRQWIEAANELNAPLAAIYDDEGKQLFKVSAKEE
jgi:hypothetical protein